MRQFVTKTSFWKLIDEAVVRQLFSLQFGSRHQPRAVLEWILPSKSLLNAYVNIREDVQIPQSLDSENDSCKGPGEIVLFSNFEILILFNFVCWISKLLVWLCRIPSRIKFSALFEFPELCDCFEWHFITFRCRQLTMQYEFPLYLMRSKPDTTDRFFVKITLRAVVSFLSIFLGNTNSWNGFGAPYMD